MFEIHPEDMLLSFLPLSHMFERTAGYYLTIVAGCRVTFARSIPQLQEDFKAVRPTIIVSVPRIFERLHAGVHSALESQPPSKRRLFDFAHRVGWSLFEWRQRRGGFRLAFLLWPILKVLVADKLLARLGGRVRLCISGGAALNPQIAHTFLGLGLPICQGYGLTEAAPVVSANTLEKNDPASIGVPLPGIEIAFGENDALLVKGPNVMLGYLGAQLKGFPGYAQVRRVAVAAEPWTVDNGMLTPTLKLRRAQILERHKDLMAELYKGHS